MTTSPSLLRSFLILAPLSVLGPLSFDTFLPALKQAGAGLGASTEQMQLTIAMISAGVAAGQLIHGPLSDRFGRRPIILGGLLLYVLTSAGTTLMETVQPVYALRFLQGLSVAASMIIMRAVVRDLYDVRTGARLFGYLFFVLATMPVAGPIIGGALVTAYGWRSVFFLMAGYGFLIFVAVALFLRESNPERDRSALRISALISGFAHIAGDRTFVSFILTGIGAYIILFSILAGMQPVMMEFLGEDSQTFGFQLAMVMAAHLVGSGLSGKLVQILGVKRLVGLGALVMAAGGIAILGFALSGFASRLTLVGPMGFMMIGFGLTAPPINAGALANFRHMAGRAASLAGFLQVSAGVLTTIALAFFATGDHFPVAITMCFGGILSLAAYSAFIRPLRQNLDAGK